MAEIKQLEPELKQATAALKLMERQFRGAGAGAQVSAKQVDNQRRIVKTLTAELKASKSELKAFQDTQNKPAKEGGILGNLAKLVAGGALLNFAHTLLTSGRNASELTKKLEELDMAAYADKFTDADKAARGFRGTMRDIAGTISSIPVIGQIFDIATASVKQGADALDSYRKTRKELNREVAGSTEMLAKLKSLEEERAKIREEEAKAGSLVERAKVAIGGLFMKGGDAEAIRKQHDQATGRAINLMRIEKERAALVEQIANAFDLEAKARSAVISGSEKESELSAIELNRQERIAALKEQVKNKFGNKSEEGERVLAMGMNKIDQEASAATDSAQRRYDITKDTLEVSSAISANALRSSLGQVDSAKELYELAKRTYESRYKAGEEQALAEKARMDQAKVAYHQAEIAYGDELTALRLQTQATEAHFKGMQGVAEQAEIVAKFDKEIATQLRAGNKEAADMLKRQKEIALATERAREHDVTPRKRREDRRDARIVQRKARQQLAREDSLRRQGLRGARGRAISEQQLKDRNANEGALRQAQAAADANALKQGMIKLFGNVDAIAGAMKGDK